MTHQLFAYVIPFLLALLTCQTPDANHQSAPTTAPGAPAWYEREIQAFEATDKAMPPIPGQVLFIGSSSIRMWTSLADDMRPMPVLDRGFGGSKTREVLAVFDRVVRPYQPSVIVYYCGDNDLGTDNTDSQAAADGFIAFHRRARAEWPGIRVLYISIKPSLARWSNWAAMAKANDLVRAYCDKTPGAAFLDVASPMLTSDGKPDPSIFLQDGLHMNEKGYAIWTKVIQPAALQAWQESQKSPASKPD